MKIGDCFRRSTATEVWAKILHMAPNGAAITLYVTHGDGGALPRVVTEWVWAPEIPPWESRGWKPASPEAFNDAYNKVLVEIEAYNVHADYVKEEGL
jgi:hypothetical protein